jgi:hypothetical protein
VEEMGYIAFEGNWEDALRQQERFAGRRVTVHVQDEFPAELEDASDLSFDEWKVRFDEACAFIDSLKGKIGPVPEGATSTENLYD